MDLLLKDRDIHVLPLSFKNAAEVKSIYLLSDVHFDSIKCDRRLFFKHLDMAKEEGAAVFILGDLYDLMNMREDPRGNYDSLRPELKAMAYIDEVIKDCTSKLEPYKDVIKLISQGNHETNITKRHGVDPIQRTVGILNDKGARIVAGYYAGWVILKCDKNGQGHRKSYPLHYHHGWGGNSRRSKGVLNIDLDMKDYPQARIIARGHTHQKWYHPVMRDYLTNNFNHAQETVHVVQTGSYKKKDRSIGWEVEKNFSTPRLGGWKFTITPQGTEYAIQCHELH
jgi:UDP-2,3-diacylglucosamine pyrophosphatase LpxH